MRWWNSSAARDFYAVRWLIQDDGPETTSRKNTMITIDQQFGSRQPSSWAKYANTSPRRNLQRMRYGSVSTRKAIKLQKKLSYKARQHWPVASDLLAAVIHENGHWVTGFESRMEKPLGGVDVDPEMAAAPLNSKFQGSPTYG